MCGGRGARFESAGEKPLFEIDGIPMVDRVIEALRRSRIETVYAVTSPLAPKTRAHVDIPSIETPGDGYVDDLQVAMDHVDLPALSVAADLPLLDKTVVGDVISRHERGSLTVVVPTALKRLLGVTDADDGTEGGADVAPTGVNVVGAADTEHRYLTYDARVAINVNRRSDAAIAEQLL